MRPLQGLKASIIAQDEAAQIRDMDELANAQLGVYDIDGRKAKVEELYAKGADPYSPCSLPERVTIASMYARFDPTTWEPGIALHQHPRTIAGRLTAKRLQGKVAFLDVQDITGQIQVLFREDFCGVELFRYMEHDFDVGDIMEVIGYPYTTPRGQLSLQAEEARLLTKSLRPPPDRRSGLVDTGSRYRYRELDMLASDTTRELFITRAKIVNEIRQWLNARSFVEIETPALQSLAGGAGSRPFTTHHNALDMELNLRISVELYLNRAIVGGFENVYDMGKVFRNEGISPKHSPEFTILEFMMAYADYNDCATATEEMLRDVAQAVHGHTIIHRNGEKIDLGERWHRVTLRELMHGWTGLDFMESTRDQVAELLDEPYDPALTWAQAIQAVYSKLVEPNVNQPTFVYDFPLEGFPITKRHRSFPELGEHCDAVIGGIELCSIDTELNDPIDQWHRFVDQRHRRDDDTDMPHPNDSEYTRAIEYGYHPTAGGGMGIDRVVMILTGAATLRDVIPFPIVKDW